MAACQFQGLAWARLGRPCRAGRSGAGSGLAWRHAATI